MGAFGSVAEQDEGAGAMLQEFREILRECDGTVVTVDFAYACRGVGNDFGAFGIVHQRPE